MAAAHGFALDLGNGLVIEGEVKAGVEVKTADDGDADTAYDTTARGYNNDAGEEARARATVTYAGEAGGVKIRLQGLGYAGNASVPLFYGWANLFDSKAVLSAGVIGDDAWGLGKLLNVFDPSLDAVTGARVEFKFVPGLNFGFALPVSEKLTIDHAAGGWIIGGLYQSDFFGAALGVAFKPGTDAGKGNTAGKWVYTGDTAGKWEEKPETWVIPANKPYVDAIAGLEVKPVSGLAIALNGRLDTRKFEDQAKIGYTRIGLKGQYASGPLSFHLTGDLNLQNEAAVDILKNYADDSSGRLGDVYKALLKATGGTEPLTEALYEHYVPVGDFGDMSLAFEVGADYTVSAPLNLYFRFGSDNILFLAGDFDVKENGKYLAENTDGNGKVTVADIWKHLQPGAGLYAKLGGKITLGSASIEIFDKVNKLGATDLQKFNAKKEVESWSPVTNQFQIDFNWSF
jgi:hypothetical protein